MRKIISFNFMSLDGFFEGPNKELDWHNVDREFHDFAYEQLLTTDLLLFGRVTYDLMAAYWSTDAAIKSDPGIAGQMNAISKIVFSRSMKKAEWNNTALVKENFADALNTLKQQRGKNIMVLGSADLSVTLQRLNLIDEYRVMISPIILGKGNPLFKSEIGKLDLRLIRTNVFNSGKVLLCYEPK